MPESGTIASAPAAAPTLGDRLDEINNGQVVVPTPLGAYQARIASILDQRLGAFARTNRLAPARHARDALLFHLDPSGELPRRPDVAVLSFDRSPRERREPITPAQDVVPDLAIDVVSPSNSTSEVLARVRDDLRTIVQLVGTVSPVERQLHIHEAGASTTIHTPMPGDTLDGAPILPGFQLPWNEPVESEANA